MDLCVALQVVLANKALAASVALVLAVTEMCLDMRSDVLPSAKDLGAALVEASPLASGRILFADVLLDLFGRDAGKLVAGVYFKIVEELGLGEGFDGCWEAVHRHGALSSWHQRGWLREHHLLVFLNGLEEGLH